jgi:hypothetical protein
LLTTCFPNFLNTNLRIVSAKYYIIFVLQLGGKLDPKAGNGHQKKAGGIGAGASATVEEPETELCGGKDMRLVKGKSMPSLR